MEQTYTQTPKQLRTRQMPQMRQRTADFQQRRQQGNLQRLQRRVG
jgi:hypothetical protein